MFSQGRVISIGHRAEKKIQNTVSTLMNKIKELETMHKMSLDATILLDLMQARTELRELLGLRIQRHSVLSHKLL